MKSKGESAVNNDTVTISRAEYEGLLKANEELTKQVEILTQQIALARKQRYGSSSEQSKYAIRFPNHLRNKSKGKWSDICSSCWSSRAQGYSNGRKDICPNSPSKRYETVGSHWTPQFLKLQNRCRKKVLQSLIRQRIEGFTSCTIVAELLNPVVRAFLSIYKEKPRKLDFSTLGELVGLVGLEPMTPTMSTWCSNQLSYNPIRSAKGIIA